MRVLTILILVLFLQGCSTTNKKTIIIHQKLPINFKQYKKEAEQINSIKELNSLLEKVFPKDLKRNLKKADIYTNINCSKNESRWGCFWEGLNKQLAKKYPESAKNVIYEFVKSFVEMLNLQKTTHPIHKYFRDNGITREYSMAFVILQAYSSNLHKEKQPLKSLIENEINYGVP